MSHGAVETRKLVEQMKDQVNRLVAQLDDLEEMKDDLEPEEYEQTKQETLDQMKEFEALVKKTLAGNMSLVDELGSIQLAMQAAVAKAFRTPEVIKLFAKREPGQLRQRLATLEREFKLNRIGKEQFISQAVEILTALSKLGEQLNPKEAAFVEQHADANLKNFESVSSAALSISAKEAVMRSAEGQIKSAQRN